MKLTIGELIAELEKYEKDIEVAVQYRDSGGDYVGQDDDIYLIKKDNILIL